MDVRQAGAATPKGQLLAREVLVQPEDFTADQDQRTRTFNPNYDHDLVPTENYILNDLENYMVHGSAYGRWETQEDVSNTVAQDSRSEADIREDGIIQPELDQHCLAHGQRTFVKNRVCIKRGRRDIVAMPQKHTRANGPGVSPVFHAVSILKAYRIWKRAEAEKPS